MRPQRIIRPDTAFSLSREKRPRKESGNHLKWLRGLPCAVCGSHKNVEAAHLRMASLRHGKPLTGMQAKPDDSWATPLCADHHTKLPNSQHNIGEEKFWAAHGIDPFFLALALWRATGNDEQGEEIIRSARR